jgi:hypothetical protein
MSALLLRICSVVYVLYAAGHTYGAMYADLKEGSPVKQAVLTAMRSYTENVQGSMRSYWDFYTGFGFMLSWTFVLLAVLCWQLAGLSRAEPSVARPLLITLFVISIPITALSWTNFFLAPQLCSTAATLLLGAAVFTTR